MNCSEKIENGKIMQIENYIERNCESIRRNSGEIDNIVIKLMRRLRSR